MAGAVVSVKYDNLEGEEHGMRGNGITYDTGFFVAGGSTHEPFSAGRVKRDLGVIRDDLHCTAVRVTGGDPNRLELAATHAADLGLEVWFSPFTCGLTTDALRDVLEIGRA